MTFEEAKILTEKHKHKVETIHATSDGQIYLNGNIEALEKHCKEQNIELFHVKPEKEIVKEIKKSKKDNGS